MKNELNHLVSMPIKIGYDHDNKSIKLTYYQGIASSHEAVEINLVLDTSASQQMLLLMRSLDQQHGIELLENSELHSVQ